jgi:hypothetical protein
MLIRGICNVSKYIPTWSLENELRLRYAFRPDIKIIDC